MEEALNGQTNIIFYNWLVCLEKFTPEPIKTGGFIGVDVVESLCHFLFGNWRQKGYFVSVIDYWGD